MNNAPTANTTFAIDAIMEVGFAPSDADEFPTWVADRWDAGLLLDGGRLLLAIARTEDEALTLSLQTPSGVIIEDMRFRLNEDGTIGKFQAAAFAAVAAAWATA